jgi:hypothetical protein
VVARKSRSQRWLLAPTSGDSAADVGHLGRTAADLDAQTLAITERSWPSAQPAHGAVMGAKSKRLPPTR